ncbi:11223_t:CDS:2 [Ambispora gerdemannii]|uniref:11223_t:CDS:1 n=1 Tax=Ambispora gerdemannii TaxID=144530 RepID=A0A9N8VKX3_9GLOM|nr:11223_t:CDS:2 [Ambispora gerdemannii]
MSDSSSRSSSAPSLAGIITTSNNERIIPATRRADGSLRPERRVREGFVPLEDVQRYKNVRVAAIEQTTLNKKRSEEESGSSFADNEEKNIDMDDLLSQKLENLSIEPMTSVKASATSSIVNTQKGSPSSNSIETENQSTKQTSSEVVITISQMEALKKRTKALEKKIRQIEQLVQRQETGESLNSDQLEKIERLAEFRDELQRIKDGEE